MTTTALPRRPGAEPTSPVARKRSRARRGWCCRSSSSSWRWRGCSRSAGPSSTRSATTPTRRRTGTSRSAAGRSRTTRTPGSRATSDPAFLNSVSSPCRRCADAVPRLVHRFRPGPVQLPVQPRPARGVPGGEPAAAAGAARPVLPAVRSRPVPEAMSDTGPLSTATSASSSSTSRFQTGFCTFVLSNYMKTLPNEIYESAMIDGASVSGSTGSSPCRCAGRRSRRWRR